VGVRARAGGRGLEIWVCGRQGSEVIQVMRPPASSWCDSSSMMDDGSSLAFGTTPNGTSVCPPPPTILPAPDCFTPFSLEPRNNNPLAQPLSQHIHTHPLSHSHSRPLALPSPPSRAPPFLLQRQQPFPLRAAPRAQPVDAKRLVRVA